MQLGPGAGSSQYISTKINRYITADVLLHPWEDFVLKIHVYCPNSSLVYQIYIFVQLKLLMMSTKLKDVGLCNNDY